MAANYWIKLYIEILNDSKMATLPDRLWRRIIEIFLAAGNYNDGGRLPNTSQLAWLFRMNTDELELDLQQIATTGIIQRTDTGWFVTKFADRQKASTDAERMRQYRERKQKQQYYGAVTNCNVDTDTESYTDTDIKEEEEKNNRPNIFSLYENNIGSITPMMADVLKEAEATYSEDWIIEALRISVANNARKWSYVQAILDDWKANGYKNDKRRDGKKPAKKELSWAEKELQRVKSGA